METMEEFCKKIVEPSKTELESTITKLKKETTELYDLIDKLEYNLEMAKQVLNDNDNYYFDLEGDYLEYSKEQGIRRNCIAGDYIFQSINDIKAIQSRLRKKEGEA